MSDHMVFSGNRRGLDRATDPWFHQLIPEGTIACWNAYRLGDAQALSWLKDGAYAQQTGGNGILESKSPSQPVSPKTK
jgi:hypothetical protein